MTNATNIKVCGYKSPVGLSCQRETDDDYCVFHHGCNRKPDEELLPNPQFQPAFDSLLDQKDGNWDGFVFPTEIKLPNTIEFPVYLRCSHFTNFDLTNTTFEALVDFSDTVFLGNAIFHNVTFKSQAIFDRCRFEDCFELQHTHFEASASFYRAEFSKRAVFRTRFGGSCNLNETIFREGASFAGWTASFGNMSATLSFGQPVELTIPQKIKKGFKKIQERINELFHQEIRRFSTKYQDVEIYRVFEGEGQLGNVVFIKPDQVSFSEVDLSRVHFRGTNLRGVRFLGVSFWQPELGRNGLYDEVFIRLNKDGPFRFHNLPALEQTCRNVRVSLEESRDFNIASDFYIAEMEALRNRLPFIKRHLFSVAALYRIVSNYGTSVFRGLLVLLLLIVLHLKLSLCFSPETFSQSVEYITENALRTVKIMSLQMVSSGDSDKLTSGQRWVDAIFRILSPVQITMLALAFRTRIKRN
jgi:uncharacterized protein YjbI with pentapeptide repeats